MLFNLFESVEEKDREAAIDSLIADSSPRRDFFIMITLSILMATFGLLLNSVTIIIGSMLIAPLLYPLLSFSLGVVTVDFKLIWQSLLTTMKSIVVAVFSAAILTAFFSPGFKETSEILARTIISVEYLVIAIIAGLAASYSLIKPQLNEHFSGVAISVALIPPLAVCGIALANFEWEIVSQSLSLFLINAFGVVAASVTVFSMMDLDKYKKHTKKRVKKEEKIIAKEKTEEDVE